MIPADTDPEAYEAQLEVWRRMAPEKKLAQVFQLSDVVRELVIAGIRDRHPEYDEEQVKHAAFRHFLGDALYREVWPDRDLLPP